MFRYRTSGEPIRVIGSASTGLPASDAQLRAVFSQAAIGIAVADLDARFLDNMPIEMLKAERAHLLGLLGTDDRDARWRRELARQPRPPR